MRALSARELLEVWEQGQGRPLHHRALLLLAAACPDESSEALARLSIGSRDARLLTLREWTFGPKLAGFTLCPACGEKLEFTMNLADVRFCTSEFRDEKFHLVSDSYKVDYRLPCTLDLSAADSAADTSHGRLMLLQRCILSVKSGSQDVSVDQLPDSILEAVTLRMAEQDLQADTRLSLSCPGCDHRWQGLFDIVSYFWNEIQAWSARIFTEVHLLASAYGWSEAEILSLSPLRRQMYLSRVGI
jgi:hypothetical protein